MLCSCMKESKILISLFSHCSIDCCFSIVIEASLHYLYLGNFSRKPFGSEPCLVGFDVLDFEFELALGIESRLYNVSH